MENKTYNITYTEDNNGVYHLYLNGEITATLPKNIDHYELVDIIQNFVLDYDNFKKCDPGENKEEFEYYKELENQIKKLKLIY